MSSQVRVEIVIQMILRAQVEAMVGTLVATRTIHIITASLSTIITLINPHIMEITRVLEAIKVVAIALEVERKMAIITTIIKVGTTALSSYIQDIIIITIMEIITGDRVITEKAIREEITIKTTIISFILTMMGANTRKTIKVNGVIKCKTIILAIMEVQIITIIIVEITIIMEMAMCIIIKALMN